MQLREREERGAVVLELEGRFDFSARREFKETIDRAQEGEARRLILDLGGLTFIDSSALGMLVVAHQNIKLKQGQICLVNPQSYVRQILDLANVPKMIPVYDTIEQACSAKDASAALAH